MTRCVAVLALAVVLVGCRAPAPSFNLMAPYGSATVPPPRTGAVGTGGTYYAPGTPGAQPAATNPAIATPPAALPSVGPPPGAFPPPAAMPSSTPPAAPPVSYMGNSTGSASDAGSSVARASFQPGSTASADSAPTRVTDEVLPSSATEPASDSPSALQLNGMRVNDATKPDEPQQFNPTSEPVNIASLPNANSTTPSFLRFIAPKPAAGSSTGTPTPAKPPSDVWQAKEK